MLWSRARCGAGLRPALWQGGDLPRPEWRTLPLRVRFRFQPWQLAAALVLLCAAAVGLLEWRRLQRYDASRLMQSLPVEGAVKMFINIEQLRDSGLLDVLAGSKTAEEPDYRHFADEIGFDYRTDLD